MSESDRTRTAKAVLAARAEASVWITRLHGPNRTPEMEAGFRRWLAERPENAAEMEGLTEIWDLAGNGQAARGVARLDRWEHSAEARELVELRARSSVRPPQAQPRIWAYAALILLTCALASFGVYRFWWMPAYATDIGEQRTLQLADGSRVSLNSNTRVVVAYRSEQRKVHLTRGEALFEVAKDRTRPFIVIAGNRQVTALGTRFIVRYEHDQTAVTLVEGKITIASIGPEPVTLTPGQRLTFARSTTPRLDTPRIEAVTAWRRGEVVLDDTPLADAIAEMNRYDKTPIVIDDPEIAGLIISGLYHTGDSEGFAGSVASLYHLKLREDDGRIHLSR